MTKKLLFIDVGTHAGQEFQAMFKTTSAGYRWKHFRKAKAALKAGYADATPATLAQLIADGGTLRTRRDDVFYVMIEPNSRLFATDVYRQADLSLNVALSTDKGGASLMPLFFANNDTLGQGSSLFVEKPNVDTSNFDYVLNLDPYVLARQLEAIFKKEGSPDYTVLLRLNNEGAEVEVIKAIRDTFGDRLKGVMGSLNDVAKVKGQKELDALHAYLADQGIPFVPLHSNYGSWAKASKFIRSVLDQG